MLEREVNMLKAQVAARQRLDEGNNDLIEYLKSLEPHNLQASFPAAVHMEGEFWCRYDPNARPESGIDCQCRGGRSGCHELVHPAALGQLGSRRA